MNPRTKRMPGETNLPRRSNHKRHGSDTFLIGFVLLLSCSNTKQEMITDGGGDSLRPASPIVTGAVVDWSTHRRLAPGSDNWPITWADDGHQYAAWGDGGGFGGSNRKGRVSLGLARIEGTPEDYRCLNVNGGTDAENPPTLEGKSYGIASIDGVLYMWVSPGSGRDNYTQARLHHSTDHGANWNPADWAFRQDDGIILPTFLQFGRDYAGSPGSIVYIYAVELRNPDTLTIQAPGAISLLSVGRSQILDRTAYRFYAGADASGAPQWTSEISDRIPVFEDPNGVGWTVSVSYNSGLGRYLLLTEHVASFSGNIGLFDAPNPWGPWTTIWYDEPFGKDRIATNSFYANFSNSWNSADGREFVLVFSGIGENDSWNSVEGAFLLETPDSLRASSQRQNGMERTR